MALIAAGVIYNWWYYDRMKSRNTGFEGNTKCYIESQKLIVVRMSIRLNNKLYVSD